MTYRTTKALAAACSKGLVPRAPSGPALSEPLVRHTWSVAPGQIVLHSRGMGRFRFARQGDGTEWRLVEIVGDPS